jgi:hypothetical protein
MNGGTGQTPAFLPLVLCGILLVILAPAINHVRSARS